jgi:hypothetical protein
VRDFSNLQSADSANENASDPFEADASFTAHAPHHPALIVMRVREITPRRAQKLRVAQPAMTVVAC